MCTPATLPGCFGDADFAIPDPGSAVALPRSAGRAYIGFVTGASGETNTLADPVKAGQELVLYLRTDGGGDRVVTVASAFDIAGNTVLTFANQGEFAAFVSVAVGTSWKWKLVKSNILSGLGATLAEIALLSGLTATSAEINAVADLSVNGSIVKTKILPITRVASTAEQDTGWDLPAKAIVLNAFVDVTTAEVTGGTKTVDVGTKSGESGGDADGFLDGVSVAATGVKQGSLVSGSVTRGLLLKETVTGSGAATHASPNTYSVSANTARSVTYSLGSNDFAELVANIVIHYIEFA